jgi:hypothetical protein
VKREDHERRVGPVGFRERPGHVFGGDRVNDAVHLGHVHDGRGDLRGLCREDDAGERGAGADDRAGDDDDGEAASVRNRHGSTPIRSIDAAR